MLQYVVSARSRSEAFLPLYSRELISSDFSCQTVSALEAVEGDPDGERNCFSTMATTTDGGADAFSEETKNTMINAIVKLRTGKLASQSRRRRRAVESEILDVEPLAAADVRIIFNCRFCVEVSKVFICIYVLAENLKTVFVPDCVLNKVNTDWKVYTF